MKSEIRVRPHDIPSGANVIDVFWRGQPSALSPERTAPGVRVISQYEPDVTVDSRLLPVVWSRSGSQV